MKQFILLIISAFLLTGCYSKLKVTVKVADREKVLENSKELVRADIVNSLIILENFVAYSNEDKDIILSNIANSYREAKKPLTKAAKQSFENAYDGGINSISNDVTKANQAWEEVQNSDSEKLNVNDLHKVYNYVNLAKLNAISFLNNLQKYVNNAGVDASLKEIGKGTKVVSTKGKLENKRMRFPILGDPLTSYITKKDNKEIWESLFNKTVSRNFIGNSDVAIILRSNPADTIKKTGDYNNNFTIKGVRMDAADATNAFFTGLTQTMNFIASTQGVQLPSNAGTDENPVAETNSLVSQMYEDRKTYEKEKKKLEDIRQMLIEKIELENLDEKESDEELNDAVKRISDYWVELEKQLKK